MKKKAHGATKMRTEYREIPKDYLMQVLQHEGLLPADATKIIATGHRPDSLTITVGFD